MIRFIDLGDQITCDGTKEFAWFDTVTDKFLEFNDTHVWGSWDEFDQDLRASIPENLIESNDSSYWIGRFKRLFQWSKI